MKQKWKERAGRIAGKIADRFADLGYWLEDLYCEYRLRAKKAKRKREKLRKTLSEEEFKRYRRKELLQTVLKGAGAVFCVAAVILLLGFGISKLVRLAGGALSSLRQTEAVTEQPVTETEPVFAEKDITVGSTGCMLLHSPFIDSYPDEEGNYDFSSIYKFITPYYSAPDYMTCEFEGALGGEELGYSGYPNFKSPDVIIENIKGSGVDLQMLATNHIYDAWSYGFTRTMEVYEEKGIAYTGIRKNEQEKHYYIAYIDGIKVGFIDYVYETTNVTGGPDKSINGMIMETADAPLLNSFNYDNLAPFYTEMEENIRAMKAEGAQFIIANMHWGTEYQLEEAQYQDEIAQKLCDLGVNAIIGGHPHCEQPIDVLTNAAGEKMLVVYSEGNALSNQRTYLMDEMPTGHTEDGAMVTLHLHQDSRGEVSLTDVDLLPTWVYRYSDESGSKYYILPLDDVANIESTMGIADIREEAQASYDRTMEVMGPGLEKAKEAFLQPVQAGVS